MQYRVNQLTENCASVTETLLQSLHLFRKDSNIHNLKSLLSLTDFQQLIAIILQVKGEQDERSFTYLTVVCEKDINLNTTQNTVISPNFLV